MKPFARRSVVYIFTPTPAGRESIELIGAGCVDKLEIAFGGSVGACDAAFFVDRTITFMEHAKR